MIKETNFEDLPRNVIDKAKHCVMDTMAVIIGGSAMEGIPAVVDLVKARGGKPESFIPFYGGKVPAPEAGLAIGPMARAMDFGDVHEEAGHCSEYTLPALLAATGLKEKVTGKEFLVSFIVGQEVLIRIGMGWKVSTSFPLGQGEGHAIFGTVAAVGKLLGLELEQLENATGIARTMTQPHDLAMFSPATLVGRIHHGFICQDAINVCLLSQRGITGPREEILSGQRGYFNMARWETDSAATTKDLGERWELLNVMIKPYACCKVLHTAIDALLDQMKEHEFQVEDIASIQIDESSPGWQMCLPKELKWNPQTVAECQFSLPYVVAIAAYNKDLFLDAYSSQTMARRDVRDLMTRISAAEDPSLPDLAARVNTTLKDGKKISSQSINVKGHPDKPMTEQELIDKFKRCVPYSAYKLSDEAVDSVIKAIMKLDKVDDLVNALILPLIPN
jgi:2-methylcitrate dehydratase PrpD